MSHLISNAHTIKVAASILLFVMLILDEINNILNNLEVSLYLLTRFLKIIAVAEPLVAITEPLVATTEPLVAITPSVFDIVFKHYPVFNCL